MKAAFLVLLLSACASQETMTHWQRIDGLRKVDHPWIEQDFRETERICAYEVQLAGPAPMPFTYPEGSDLANGVANIMRGEVYRHTRESLYQQCMAVRGYQIEKVVTQ